MPLDAICLTAVAAELRRAVIGGKVDKIYQPTRDEVVLHMRTGQGNVRMLLSANPQHPRAHLTETPRENPDTPPMFCMLLRKYFLGGRILAITQPSMERLLEFQFETLSELGRPGRTTAGAGVPSGGKPTSSCWTEKDGLPTACAG